MKKNRLNNYVKRPKSGHWMRTDDVMPEKLITREELNKHIDDFLNAGGKIQKLKISDFTLVNCDIPRGTDVEEFLMGV